MHNVVVWTIDFSGVFKTIYGKWKSNIQVGNYLLKVWWGKKGHNFCHFLSDLIWVHKSNKVIYLPIPKTPTYHYVNQSYFLQLIINHILKCDWNAYNLQ